LYKIGVVGPLSSLKKIRDVTNEFEHEIDFIDFSYEDAREVTDIIKKHQSTVNGWFFSGPVPYRIAKGMLDSEANFTYCPPVGSSLYRCLLQMSADQKHFFDKLSIDMIRLEDFFLHESLQELGISTEHIYVKTFDEQYDYQEIVQFQVHGVLTVLQSVYEALKKESVPVYKINMTKMEIRQAVKILIEKAKSTYFKDSQIGVEIIEIDQFDQFVDEVNIRYHLQHLELKIKQTLLTFCEKLDGSLIENGNGRYQIFSSRKAIEREIGSLRSTVQQLALEMDVSVAVGIGFGETAASAEINARKAIRHSKKKESSGIVVIQEDGVMIESVGQEEQLAYTFRSNDKELLDKLNQANISVKTYKKIEALIDRMGWDGFTSSDLASHLTMTVRNAQRIISGLSESGLVEYKGEELQSPRGRPRKIYMLKK
jgi:GTP cyclohydrolase III